MLDFPSILPPNRSSFEAALEQVIRKTKPDLSPVATLMDPDLCPGELLGWLAWAFSVDVWDPAWDEAAKRRVLKHSLAMHRRKGTVASVKTALSVLGFHVDLAEWLETGGAPYTFRLDAYSVEVVAAGQELNARLLNIT
ncbi:phage tail protein I, partial [Leisingera sp. MMG026]|uniref:phage tail protein I n=1 Tax=Leisingera sp. MMG026 TaxID=2909982 RepID=UPI0031CCBE2B|nr:phage tail protein I [Leisingera sp. MMG026]